MQKYLPVYLYGSVIILAGIFFGFSKNSSFNMIQHTLGFGLVVGAIFAFITAFTQQRKKVQFAYHELHALTILVYGVTLLLFCHSFEALITYKAFLFVFYTLSEFLFCIWLFNLANKVVIKIALLRVSLGLILVVGTVAAMHYTENTIQVFGILFIVVGINILLYVPVMKINNSVEVL